ncbi:MAG: efflux transporter outer membrane subunit [Pseudomonadota bacterium]
MQIKSTGLFGLLLGLALSACINLPEQPDTAENVSKDLSLPEEWQQGDVIEDPAPQVGWIGSFEDDILSALVVEAQSNNNDLRVAGANVSRALALSRSAGANLKPAVDLVTNVAESGILDEDGPVAFNPLEPFQTAGLRLQWEVDVWGRLRAADRAAGSDVEATAADYLFSQYSIAAAVARTYFIAIEAMLQEQIALDTKEALEEILRIVRLQFENGVAASQDVALARSDLATTIDAAESISGAKRDALRALEILVGRYPGAQISIQSALPQLPSGPAPGLPSEILERRPDLIAAERRVAAAFDRVTSAKAARLPTISLNSQIGGASDELSNLLDPANVVWSVGGNLLAPIFDGGRRRAQVEITTAEQEASLAQYRQAALQAFEDVEGSLDQGQVLARRLVALQEAADTANEALRLSELRFRTGETDLIDVLTIQQRVFSTQSNWVAAQRLILEQRVDLNLALGGSWE